MDKRVIGTAIAVILTASAPAQARDNDIFGFQCSCECETSAGVSAQQFYRDLGLGCGALNNRTCNIEDPQTGQIRSGRTWGCSPAHEPLNGGAQSNGVLDPGNQPPVRNGIAGPLPGVFDQ